MSWTHVAFLVSLVGVFPMQLFAQSPHWESLDGPYIPEARTHLLFPDGDRLFYGTNTGMFRMKDAGQSWVPVGPPVTSPYQNTTTVYQSPGGTLFANLYYLNPWPHSVYVNRLLRSTDRGEHWISTWGTYNGAEGARQTMGLAMAFGGGDTVYISSWFYQYAGSGGNTATVLRSTDAGATWSSVYSENYTGEGAGYPTTSELQVQSSNLFVRFVRSVQVWPDVQVHPATTSLRSTDGGTTWLRQGAGIVFFFPPTTLLSQSSVSLNFSADDGKTWTETLAADSGFTSLISDSIATVLVLRKPDSAIFRSSDAGQTWDDLGPGPADHRFSSIRFYGKTFLVGQTKDSSYYRSTDYGTNWAPILDPDGRPLSGTIQPASDSLFVIADWRGNWIESDDAGGSWREVVCPYENQKITALLALPSGSLFASSTTSLARKREGKPWVNSPELSKLSEDYRINPCFLFSLFYREGPSLLAGSAHYSYGPSSYPGSVYAVDTSSFQTQSIQSVSYDDCRSIYVTGDGTRLVASSYRLLRIISSSTLGVGPYAPVDSWTALGEDSAHALWAANDSLGLFRSVDTGLTWNASNGGLTNPHALCITVASNGNIFAGTRGGGVFRSTDNGGSWAPSGLSADTVQALLAGRESVLYAGTTRGVLASTDAGTTWAGISSGLTLMDIHALAEGPDGTVYCGTWGDGVYRLIGKVAAPSDMVLVQGGTFSMGSTTGDPDEQPIHSVTLHSFYLNPKEVSVADYRAYCAATGQPMPAPPSYGWTEVNPMVNVTWDEASAYAAWKGKRLPTEAEWEYAARGGKLTQGYLYSGSGVPDSVAWDSLTSGGAPHGGASKRANELGLYDMSGNVWEWCSDWYAADYYGNSPASDPRGPTTGVGLRVSRGGSFRNGPYACRVSDRSSYWHDSYAEGTGFRLAMDAPLSSTKNHSASTAPTSFVLEQNYPNPFNPSTRIKYTVAGAGAQGSGVSKIRLAVYDLLGREVAVLVDEKKSPGSYEVIFDASGQPSGVYFYRLTAGSFLQTRKFLLLK